MRYFVYVFKKRVCQCCGEEKDLDAFTWTPTEPNNRSTDCKTCVAIQEHKGVPTKKEAVNQLVGEGLNRSDIRKYPELIELKRNDTVLKRKILNG